MTLTTSAPTRRVATDGCPLCGADAARERFHDGEFAVLDCAACDVTYVSPRASAAALIDEVYGADYWRSAAPRERGYADYRGDGALYRRTFARRLRALRGALPPPGRALDVGCAAGYGVEALLDAGWDAFGLEPSRAIAASARARLGSRVVEGTLADAAFAPGSFELVTLWDVLEHLPDPLAALERVRALLTPDGRAVIETQDVASPVARLAGRRWHHYKHREHLVHFTPRTLEATLARAGLRLVRLQRRGAGKYVRGEFLVERSARLHPRVPGLLRPLLGGRWSVYVNPGDEMIAVAEVAR